MAYEAITRAGAHQRGFQIVVAVPPVEIVRWIEAGSEDQNDIISTAPREIALLRQYRTCLVADVVTGKLDVRAAAAGLPEEAEGLGSLDEADTLSADEEDAEGNIDTSPVETEA